MTEDAKFVMQIVSAIACSYLVNHPCEDIPALIAAIRVEVEKSCSADAEKTEV